MKLPEADEAHRIPSGYWKIISVQFAASPDSIKVAGFIFDQDTPRDSDVLNHLCTIDEIEIKSGLNFLRDLPDDLEEKIESSHLAGLG